MANGTSATSCASRSTSWTPRHAPASSGCCSARAASPQVRRQPIREGSLSPAPSSRPTGIGIGLSLTEDVDDATALRHAARGHKTGCQAGDIARQEALTYEASFSEVGDEPELRTVRNLRKSGRPVIYRMIHVIRNPSECVGKGQADGEGVWGRDKEATATRQARSHVAEELTEITCSMTSPATITSKRLSNPSMRCSHLGLV